MGGYAPRAREDSVRPRPLVRASGRSLNFTVRRLSRGTPSLPYPIAPVQAGHSGLMGDPWIKRVVQQFL